MLRFSYTGFSVALLFCLPIVHAESTANKCTDGKHITYANMPCEKLGLKSIGPVKDAVIVVPAIQKPKKEASDIPGKEPGEKDVSGNDAAADDVPSPGIIKPVNPLLEKLLQ